MNVETDREFRQTRDSREWKLNSYIFRELIQINLVHLLENRSFQSGQSCFSNILASQVYLCFSPFCTHSTGFSESKQDLCLVVTITPAWTGPWNFLGPLKTFVKYPLLLPALKDLLKSLAGKLNPLLMQNPLQLMGWKISGRTYLQKEYQRGLPTLSQTIGKHLQSSITNQLERSGVASVLIRRYLLPDLT